MKIQIKNADAVEAKPVEIEGAQGVQIRLLVHQADGAPNFYMRQFSVEPGGFTPRHSHAWEHEVYIVSGTATVWTGEGEKPAPAGTCVFVPGGEEHQFTNASGQALEFLCLVPKDSQ